MLLTQIWLFNRYYCIYNLMYLAYSIKNKNSTKCFNIHNTLINTMESGKSIYINKSKSLQLNEFPYDYL